MDLPVLWKRDTIGKLFETVTGSTPPKSQKDNYGKEIPFVKPPELIDAEILDTADNLSEKGASISRTLPPGSVLVSCIGNLGKLGINSKTVAFNQQINAIKPNKNFISKFMFYQALSPSFKAQLQKLASGTTVPIVNKSKFNSINVVLPPLAEQKQIVAILDDAFANIDHARQLAECNLKNARELFDSSLNQIFLHHGDGWFSDNLKNLTTKIGSGATPRGGKDSYKDTGIPLIRSLNVHDRAFRKKDLAFLDDAQAAKLDNVIVQTGDVLLNITGASVARCCIAPDEYLPARVNQHVSIIRPKPDQLLPEFLNYLLTSKYYKDQLLGIGEAGSTRQAITKAQLEYFDLSYPETISEQQSIAEKVRELQKQTDRLESIYQQKITALDELKQSLLQKAFRGELMQAQTSAA